MTDVVVVLVCRACRVEDGQTHRAGCYVASRYGLPVETTYVFTWGNDPRRAELKGRECRLVCSGTKNSVLLEFLDTGERVVASRYAIRVSPGQLTLA